MWSAGTHLVIRLVEFLALVFTIPFVYLYTQYGSVGALAVLGTYGLSVIGLLATTWDKINKPLSDRLNYLNVHAFSPLANSSGYTMGYVLSLDSRVGSDALAALRSQQRYLSIRVYPKKLLTLTVELARDSKEYEPLFWEINNDNQDWINEHSASWKPFGASPDMGRVNSVLGIPGATIPRPAEFVTLVQEFVDSLKEKKSKMVDRFVTLSKEIQREKEGISTVLDSYMRSNMLHVLSASGLPN